MSVLELRYDSAGFSAEAFIALAQRIWPRDYDVTRTAAALSMTTNIGAWDGASLVGVVRVLTDGYFFATVPEILVDPDYQRRGIGRELMRLALDTAPRGKLFFGAQAQSVDFFTKIGCLPGPVGFVATRASGEPSVPSAS
jgi:ribosomal protein S18 acetylase RimI-like enzyme